MIAPAARRLAATGLSPRGNERSSASAPAVVGRPATSMLSFTSTGMPCSGPRTRPRRRSRSARRASRSAAGFTMRTALMAGPDVFVCPIRAR